MKELVSTTLLIIQPFFCFGQQNQSVANDINNSGAIKLIFATSTEKARELANEDLKNGTHFLFLQSGIAPVAYKTDSIFQQNYDVDYYEQGCIGPEKEFMKEYNFVIFNKMEVSYGKKWKRQIRKDVIGYKEWKKKN